MNNITYRYKVKFESDETEHYYEPTHKVSKIKTLLLKWLFGWTIEFMSYC